MWELILFIQVAGMMFTFGLADSKGAKWFEYVGGFFVVLFTWPYCVGVWFKSHLGNEYDK